MKKVKIGFAAGFMDGFSNEGLDKFFSYQKKLKAMEKDYNFNLISYDTIIKDRASSLKVRKDLEQKKIDFLLLFHPSYIVGDYVYEIMKAADKVGLWAIEEPRREGPMPLASFVNMEQNAGIAKHNFKANPRKVKWFFGDIDSAYFMPRFDITLKALAAAVNIKDARIGQIGKLADGHINHMYEPREVYKNLGIDVVRDYEVEDIIAASQKVSDSQARDILGKLDCRIERVAKKKVLDSVKMYIATRDICRSEGYSAVAFSCWPKLMPLKEMVGCLINSLLNSDGIVAGCEADVLGTASMLILRYLTLKEVAIMDLPVFDPDDNSLLLWHCGSAPVEMANKRGMICEKHYFADYDESIKGCGPITDIVFKSGDLTVFRICGESESFYYFTGKIQDTDKPAFNGSRGWVKDIKFLGQPANVMDVANTLLTGGLPHHFPMVMENAGKYIEEFAYWMGLSKVRRYDYRDYMYV
ncbi:MAG: hypothetical protein ACQEP5_07525 [Actinomycetota bacterium]